MAQSVLVVNPWVTDFKLYDEWMHPLGLYALISLLQANGVDVRFFNCLARDNLTKEKRCHTGDFPACEIEKPAVYRAIPRKYKRYGRPIEALLAFLEQTPRPDCICLGSMMTYWLPGVAETAAAIRSVHPDVPLVIGGIAARLVPEAVRRTIPGAIIGGVIDRSEQFRLCDAMPALVNNEPLSLLGGLTLLDHPPHCPILMSLGCPMACSYCASPQLQGNFRLRPHELVMRELRYCIDHHGVRDFAFYDDALLFGQEQGIIPLLQGLALLQEQSGLRPRLHAPNGLHLRFIDDRVAAHLKASGFATLRFGYESGEAGYGSETSRKATRQEARDKIGCLKRAGFDKSEIGVYVMAGLPGQQPSQVCEEIAFVTSLGVKAKPVWVSPVPGTRLFKHYAQQFPQLRTDPLWHNDMFFITQLPGWSWEAVEQVREKAYELNK